MEQFIQNMLIGIRQWVNEKLAGVNEAIDNKQDILTAGDNIEITSAGTISVTGITEPIASDFDIKDLSDTTGLREEWSGKQDALTAGANIEIDSAGTISATGVTSATEQALEDMSFVISSNINELDGRITAVESGKQDALTAGNNIEITSAGTISVTGIVDDTEIGYNTTFSSSKILDLVNAIAQFNIEVVDALPESGMTTNTIYLVPSSNWNFGDNLDISFSEENNARDEYLWVIDASTGEGHWELIGSTQISLADYYTVEEVNHLLDEKQNEVNVTIAEVLAELNGLDERVTALEK